MSEFQPVKPTDAASLVILRGPLNAPEVLMGRRRKSARFMPDYYVYPGGAVDGRDLALVTGGWGGSRFHAAAIRETWEETGVAIAERGAFSDALQAVGPCFSTLNDQGLMPTVRDVHYIARAITPPESPIRFDTRFFLTDTRHLHGTPHAVGELPEVLWLPVVEALSSPRLSGVTKFVLGEALSLWQHPDHLTSPTRPVRVYTYADNARVIHRESQTKGLA